MKTEYKQYIIFALLTIFLTGVIMATDFTPQGDINMRGIYAMKNATNVTAQYFCNATACFTISQMSTDTNTLYYGSGVYIYLNGSNYIFLNETRLNATITSLMGPASYTNLSQLIDDLGNRGYTHLSNFTDDITYSTKNTNSSNYWDNLNTTNVTQFENQGGVLHIVESWVTSFINTWFGTKTTDNLAQGSTNLYDNKSWNESGASLKFYGITNPWNLLNATTISNSTIARIGNCTNGQAVMNITTSGVQCRTLPTDTNCSVDQSCANILYTSALPLANKTSVYCGNITGAVSNLCTITGAGGETDPVYVAGNTTIARTGNCSAGQVVMNMTTNGPQCVTPPSGGNTSAQMVSAINNTAGLFNITVNISMIWNGSTGMNATQFTGNGVKSISETWLDTIYLRISNLVGAVGNWTLDKPNYYTKTEVNTNITNANTSVVNWADSKFYDSSENAQFLTVNTGQGTNELYKMDQNVTTTDSVVFGGLNVSQFRINTANITCFNGPACTWFMNATDSCTYWPSGGKDCSG